MNEISQAEFEILCTIGIRYEGYVQGIGYVYWVAQQSAMVYYAYSHKENAYLKQGQFSTFDYVPILADPEIFRFEVSTGVAQGGGTAVNILGNNNVSTRAKFGEGLKGSGVTKGTSQASLFFRSQKWANRDLPDRVIKKLPNKLYIPYTKGLSIRTTKWGVLAGRLTPVVGLGLTGGGVAISAYNVCTAENTAQAIQREAWGWAGAYVGAKLGVELGAVVGPASSVITGIIGGGVGFFFGVKIGGEIAKDKMAPSFNYLQKYGLAPADATRIDYKLKL